MAALDRSPIASRGIGAKGPRYCPSLDDKILKFPDKESHPIFLEPVGRNSREIYMQNFSTYMPPDVQLDIIHTLPGCERALMLRPGYGIEYDYVVPAQLEPWLETRAVRGLYCSGQICGTSGYEEAASLGFMAGVNAALSVQGREPLVLGRNQAYVGVLIDDLVSRGTDEPYRMLPSRCEHRLIMRHDNADRRLLSVGRDLGLIDDDRWNVMNAGWMAADGERKRLSSLSIQPNGRINDILREVGSSEITESVSAIDMLRRPEVSWRTLARLVDTSLDEGLGTWIEIEVKYEGYVERENRRVRRLQSMELLRIPESISYGSVAGLSAEAAEKLARTAPRTLGQASRIPGVNNVDIQLVHVAIEKLHRSHAEA
jgi:tRNA uridine 5-carboxymethylaminomethyl modification enzyme